MADDKDTNEAPKAATKKAAEPVKPSTADKIAASREYAADEREALSAPADISPAGTEGIAASGAIVEPEVLSAVDVDHPAVDNNPREFTTERQNQIDFNDPTLTSEEAVQENLSKQG